MFKIIFCRGFDMRVTYILEKIYNNEQKVLKELLIDVKRRMKINKLEFDFMLITGDVTYSGQKKNLTMFKIF